MAVEAHHLHFFPRQLISNRETMNSIETNSNLYNTQMSFGFSGAENLLPLYNSAVVDPVAAAALTQNQAESGLTCNLSGPRKRMREAINQSFNPYSNTEKDRNEVHSFSFLGEDISFHLQQQQLGIDRFISQHVEKLQRDLFERRRQHARELVAGIESSMMKRLRAKEEEIEKMGRLNLALEERVKSLCLENQIWQDLAQTSEATANALRSNLEQILARVRQVDRSKCHVEDDAESCCGSSGGDDGGEGRRLAGAGVDEDCCEEGTNVLRNNKKVPGRCRGCGEREACVLLLPCRHLCLCGGCSSFVQACPICNCSKNGSVHVNMS